MTEHTHNHSEHHHTHPESQHHHEHTHSHEAPITQRWKWVTVLGNAAIGAAELATGSLSTLAVTSDGLHNVGDTATYYMQAENILNPSYSEKRRLRMRKIAHWVIAATSLGMGAKAGVDLAMDQEHAQHAGAIYTASASLALNLFMLARLRGGIRRKRASGADVYENDLAKHFLAVDLPSAGLAVTGAVLQKYNVDIEQMAAVASGAVGAYAFRPTTANLAHNCLDHDHGHGHEATAAHPKAKHRKQKLANKSWFAQLRYRPTHQAEKSPAGWRTKLGLGLSAIALLSSSGSVLQSTSAITPEMSATPSDSAIPQSPNPEKSQPSASAMTCRLAEPGDSYWSVIEEQLATIQKRQPALATTNAITNFTLGQNRAVGASADTIAPNSCLTIPNQAALTQLATAIEQTGGTDQFANDVRSLNFYATRAEALADESKIMRINAHLQATAR